MKNLLFVSGLVLFIGFAPSCKKCMTCSTVLKSNGQTVDTYPEICGKKATLDAQELNYRRTLPDSLELNCPRD
jgi:hypothetical protein